MKKRFSMLLLAACAVQLAAAQTGNKGWQIGLAASPDYSYRSLGTPSGNTLAGDMKRFRDGVETGRVGFTAGLEAQRYFSRHLGLSMGLQYAQRSYAGNKAQLVYEDQFDPGSGAVTGEKIDIGGWYKYRYLELPLGLLYRSNASGKVAFTANAGVSANVLLGAQSHYVLTSSSGAQRSGDYSIRNLNSFNLSAFLGAGVEFRAGERLKIGAGPVFRYSLLPVTEGIIKEHLWAAGLRVGLLWSL